MSDYFGALLRSGGLPVSGIRPVTGDASLVRRYNPEDFGIHEIDEQRIVPAGAASNDQPTVPSTPAATRAGSGEAEALAVGPVNPALPPPLKPTRPESPNAAPAPELARDDERLASPTLPMHAEPTFSEPAASPSSGPALVQTALRWIAAGERITDEASESSPTPPPLRASSEPPDAHERSAAASTITPDPPAPAMPLTPVPERAPMRAQPRAAPEATASLREPAADRRAAVPGFPREEVIEVSIGAIHVRVDAPPAVAVTPTPPAPQPAVTPAPRSGLSRRALWRI